MLKNDSHYQVTRVRNYEAIPHLQEEGYFIKSLPIPPTANSTTHHWAVPLKAHDRLFYHQTLNRARKSAQYWENEKIPKDHLDFALGTQYVHDGKCSFPENEDVTMQHETVGNPTFKIFRNTRDFIELVPCSVGHPKFGKKKNTNEKNCFAIIFL